MINPITTEFFIAVHRTGGSLCRDIIVGCGEIPITGRVGKDVVPNGRHFVLSRVLSQPPQHYHIGRSAYYLNYFAYVDSGCPSKQSIPQINPEVTQDSLRSHTKYGGFWKIKGKGLCCKFFLSTQLISVANVVCTLIPWIGSLFVRLFHG